MPVISKGHSKPLSIKDIDELLKNVDSICQIAYNNKSYGGNGFFLDLNIKDIPFNKCLLTNNHVLNNEALTIGNEISLLCNENIILKIEITKDRKVFTDEILDYTCIEILPQDNIKQFFKIDAQILENAINTTRGKEIFSL